MKTDSAPSVLLLVSPDHFSFNKETADSNAFQKDKTNVIDPHHLAMEEFKNLCSQLDDLKIEYAVVQSPAAYTPDAVFPNNWFSTHESGQVLLYPMMAENRRKERNPAVQNWLMEKFQVAEITDLSFFEKEGKFLEGTGSLVLDHENHVAYACLSPRTDEGLIKVVASLLNYDTMIFSAQGPKGEDVYHTNVVMAIGHGTAVICDEAIPDLLERSIVVKKLQQHKKVILLSFDQMLHFAGNMLQVRNIEGKRFWLMSNTALNSLTEVQKEQLAEEAQLVGIPIPTIENIGGGSIRCMLAGIHLNKIPH